MTCRSSIVGAYYRTPKEKSVLYNSSKGDRLVLRRDKANEFDSNAVKVLLTDERGLPYHVGFLSKSDALIYGRAMDAACLKQVSGVMLNPIDKYPTIQFELPEEALNKARESLEGEFE